MDGINNRLAIEKKEKKVKKGVDALFVQV